MKHGKITHIDLFSGIGGFALAADRVFGNVEHVFCDNEPFAQEVLKKHWPRSEIYGDIRTLTYSAFIDDRGNTGELSAEDEQQTKERQKERTTKPRSTNIQRPFILTGGFPCQPFSQAGRRRGEEDDRFLWPEMLRVIGEFSPQWVIAENVRGLLTQGGGVVFERVCIDLEVLGYEVQPLVIPVVAVGAPHRRDRVWFVAHRTSERPDNRFNHQQGRHLLRDKNGDAEEDKPQRNGRKRRTGEISTDAPNSTSKYEERRDSGQREAQFRRSDWEQNWLEVATRLCRVDDGIPRRLDRNPRLKALGNAIVPQVAEEIMKAIKHAILISASPPPRP